MEYKLKSSGNNENDHIMIIKLTNLKVKDCLQNIDQCDKRENNIFKFDRYQSCKH